MRYLSNSLLLCLFVTSVVLAQTQVTPPPQPSAQDDEVIRVSTELVQTDVIVFDKSGHFVDGLQREQFELRVDGKPQPLSLFDRVVAGSENNGLVSSVKNSTGSAALGSGSNGTQRGRTVVFFIDDLHLSASSMKKTRQAILDFIEKEMTDNDQVAIASAIGQIGFLQQFTDNKSVLRAALGRLNYRPYTIQDSGATMTMTEYQAIRVDQGDRDTIEYYASQLLKETNVKIRGAGGLGPPRGGGPMGQPPPVNANAGGMTKESAERMIKERANVMLRQSGSVTNNTLLGLESLMRFSAQLPGRKLVFLVSDGFFLNDRNTGFGEKLRQITDAAVRSGAVIYSLDARGLVSMTDVSTNRPDPEGHLSRSNQGELAASQDALFALAEDTGGRALLNSDALNGAVRKALDETSNYYLLAWRPNEEEQKAKNYKRIEVSIVGRPDLVVKLPKGYLQAQADAEMARADAKGDHARNRTPTVPGKDQPEKSIDADIQTAMAAPAPRHALPTSVSVTFLDTPNNGPIITASVQAATAGLDYGSDSKQAATIDLAGVVLNDQGKQAAGFKSRLNVTHLDQQQNDGGVVYTYKTPLAPGLYQVRAVTRDQKSGKVGSSSQWIEIPDLKGNKLTLSSLLLGAQVVDVKPKADATKPEAAAAPQVLFSVDRRFKKSSQLGFWVFIYNATRATGATSPDLTAQIEVVGNGKTVVKTDPRKLATATMDDPQRIPYGGHFPLSALPAGRYVMNVTITDQIAKSSASQRLSFQVE
ncbi:MAG TPA: VWA domain-containing protein [Pyrinomonadaceae bacterium]|jgi:VWFA-related protein|nr:VWA domain-containing protein [Pyrinomonadaceae bacterium]